MKKTEVHIIRCAVYTRKSLEDSQEMEFNSIDAQREAAENYIASGLHAHIAAMYNLINGLSKKEITRL